MSQFKFSVGPWNVHEGADAFGPEVRGSIAFEKKVAKFKEIGFDAVQFHDDDAVPVMNGLSDAQIRTKAREVKKVLDNNGMATEFVAPRLWMDPRTVDGGFTSNSKEDREFALWRAYKSIDIANELGCDKIVLWLAREGTLCAESKSAVESVKRLIEAINK
ncbi:MAG: TIM barrel protein, partial [Ruminiclostridium sp.]|nr:TIM barrel protein [Ruminiclostridium sp.]